MGGVGDDTGWDGWMASLTQWTWVWVDSGSWWWTGRPGVLSMGWQRVRHNWATELNWISKVYKNSSSTFLFSHSQYCSHPHAVAKWPLELQTEHLHTTASKYREQLFLVHLLVLWGNMHRNFLTELLSGPTGQDWTTNLCPSFKCGWTSHWWAWPAFRVGDSLASRGEGLENGSCTINKKILSYMPSIFFYFLLSLL